MAFLTQEDISLLKSWNYPDEDIPQIERNAHACVYTVFYKVPADQKSKRISRKKALEVLGRENFLSGLARSAFHWSAVREGDKINASETAVLFDARKLFK